MRSILHGAALLVMIVAGTAAFAQTKSTPVLEAFEHYELVRAALAADSLTDAAPHATALADKAEAAGGATAKKAADALAAAKNIEDARKQFGELSAILVPLFQA